MLGTIRGAFVVVLTVSFAAFGCNRESDGDPVASECQEVASRIVEMQSSSTSLDKQAELERHRAHLDLAIRDRVVADCMSRPSAQRECLLAANSTDDIKECL